MVYKKKRRNTQNILKALCSDIWKQMKMFRHAKWFFCIMSINKGQKGSFGDNLIIGGIFKLLDIIQGANENEKNY